MGPFITSTLSLVNENWLLPRMGLTELGPYGSPLVSHSPVWASTSTMGAYLAASSAAGSPDAPSACCAAPMSSSTSVMMIAGARRRAMHLT